MRPRSLARIGMVAGMSRKRKRHVKKELKRVRKAKRYKPVPPTPYYYGKRAEMFLHDAEQALAEGNTERHAQLMVRATHYRDLAGELPLER